MGAEQGVGGEEVGRWGGPSRAGDVPTHRLGPVSLLPKRKASGQGTARMKSDLGVGPCVSAGGFWEPTTPIFRESPTEPP